jgi:hypothetical protein
MKRKRPTSESIEALPPKTWVEYAGGKDLETYVRSLRRQARILGVSALGCLGVVLTDIGIMAHTGEYASPVPILTTAAGFLGLVLLGGNARGASDYRSMIESPLSAFDLARRHERLGLPLVIHYREPDLPPRDQVTGGLVPRLPLEESGVEVQLPSFAHIGFAIPIADAVLYRPDLVSEPRADQSELTLSI